jgi:hypothetical protein
MFMLSGSFITSGLPTAPGAAMAFWPAAATLGLALLLSVLILAWLSRGEGHASTRRIA